MQITLMRHGKPRMQPPRWLSPADVASWVEHYNRAVIDMDAIPAAAVQAASDASSIVSSTAPRTLSSVAALGRSPSVEDAIFIEAGLPSGSWTQPRLPVQLWVALFRLLWFCGYAEGAESLRMAKARAGVAAQRLIALAAHGPVVLVGHGIMNRLIANQLSAAGWMVRTRQGSRYWAMGVYVRPAM